MKQRESHRKCIQLFNEQSFHLNNKLAAFFPLTRTDSVDRIFHLIHLIYKFYYFPSRSTFNIYKWLSGWTDLRADLEQTRPNVRSYFVSGSRLSLQLYLLANVYIKECVSD